MEGYPRVDSTYTLTTWVESWTRHFSERIIMIADENGNPYGFCRTVWMVLDYESRESAGLSHLSLPAAAVIPGECPIARQAGTFPDSSRRRGDASPGSREEQRPDGAVYIPLHRPRLLPPCQHRQIRVAAAQPVSLRDFDETMVRHLELAFLHEATYAMTVNIHRHNADDTGRETSSVSSFYITDTAGSIPVLFARVSRVRRSAPVPDHEVL